jgi:preprotein translocase subunit SecD
MRAIATATLTLALLAGCYVRHRPLTSGTELVYQIDPASPDLLEEIRRTLTRRLDLHGLREVYVETREPDRVVVQVPGTPESLEKNYLRKVIEGTGSLRLVLVAKPESQTRESIEAIREEERRYEAAIEEKARRAGSGTPVPLLPEPPHYIARPFVEDSEGPGFKEVKNSWGNLLTVLENEERYKVDGRFLIEAWETIDENNRPTLAFQFKREGAEKLAALTEANADRDLAILFDDRIRQIAKIKSRIYDRAQLTGNFTREEVRAMVSILRGGSLPAKIHLLSETFGER